MAPVTLTDIASKAGVSEATVSRVLSGSRPVGKATADNVRKVARQLGYTGNSIARALRKNRTDTVGMVVPSILNPFFTGLVDSMERALQRQGKQLFLCDSRQDPEVEAQQLESLLSRQVDGIVISACHLEESAEAIRNTSGSAPLVQLDRRVEIDGTDWVGVDDDAAMKQIMNHLRSGDCTSPAFVSSGMTNSSTGDRLEGFRRHAKRLGMTIKDEWIILRDYSITSGEKGAQQLFSGSGPHPDAVVCADDLIAFGVLKQLRSLGIRVPEDVQVTGFDDIPFAAYLTPSLTSLRQPTDRMASSVLQLLEVARTGADSHAGARIALAPALIARDSTRDNVNNGG